MQVWVVKSAKLTGESHRWNLHKITRFLELTPYTLELNYIFILTGFFLKGNRSENTSLHYINSIHVGLKIFKFFLLNAFIFFCII